MINGEYEPDEIESRVEQLQNVLTAYTRYISY